MVQQLQTLWYMYIHFKSVSDRSIISIIITIISIQFESFNRILFKPALKGMIDTSTFTSVFSCMKFVPRVMKQSLIIWDCHESIIGTVRTLRRF